MPASDRVLTAFGSFAAGGSHWDTAFVAFDQGLRVAMYYVDAANRLFTFGPFEASRVPRQVNADEDNDDANDDKTKFSVPVETDEAIINRRLLMNAFLRDFVVGRGYPSVLCPPSRDTDTDTDVDLASRVHSLQLDVSATKTAPTTLRPPHLDYIKKVTKI